MKAHIKKQRGFSLIEMAIVIASLAAIVTVTTQGIAILHKSKLGDIVSDINGFADKMIEFDELYDGLPGDIAETSAITSASGIGGNGNGAIDTDVEALRFWQHLSYAGLIDGSYDGTSGFKPGEGVPKGSIATSGYKIVNLSGPSLPSVLSNIGKSSVVFEFSGFDSGSDERPIISAEDAKSIDERIDDGQADTGIIRVAGADCSTANVYNLQNKSLTCRLFFIISSSTVAQNPITGICNKAGLTRETPDSSKRCPVGYEGRVMEICKINSFDVGSWQQSGHYCAPIECSGGKKAGQSRTLSCINNQIGSGTIQECSTEGIWVTKSEDCVVDTSAGCTNGDKRGQACNIGYTGNISQTCVSGAWQTDVAGDNCVAIKCSADALGTAQNGAVCGANYAGTTLDVCMIDGTFEVKTNQCSPQYSGVCTAGNTRSINCPPGEVGDNIQICIENSAPNPNYWTTQTDTCKPKTCSSQPIGSYRVAKGESCPNNSEGVVMQVCKTTGWVNINSNCAQANICKGSGNLDGFARWADADSNDVGLSATVCTAGYAPFDGSTLPTRDCDGSGNWTAVTNACIKKQCVNDNAAGAIWPTIDSGTTGALGLCPGAAKEGQVIRDCDNNGDWTTPAGACDNTSIPIKTNLSLWLDGNDTNTIFQDTNCTSMVSNLTSAGGTIGCWRDKSGNNNHAKQTSSANRPVLNTNAISNRTALNFDGSNHYMTVANDASFDVNTDMTYFTVFSTDQSSASQGVLTKFANGTHSQYGLVTNSANSIYIPYEVSNNDGAVLAGSTYSTATSYITSSTITSGATPTVSLHVNGALSNSADLAVTTNTGQDIYIGAWGGTYSAGSKLDGNIAELIFYKKELSLADRCLVEAYLSDKWGIAISTSNCSAASTLPFTTGLQLWLDSDDASTLFTDSGCSASASAGNTVGCWQDKSGNGKHAIQASSAKEPTYSSARAINGKNVMDFDGSSGSMNTVSTIDLSATDGVTMIYLMQNDTTSLANKGSNTFASFPTNGFLNSLYRKDSLSVSGFFTRVRGNAGNNEISYDAYWTTPVIYTAVMDRSLTNPEAVAYKNSQQLTDQDNNGWGTYKNNTNNFGNETLYIGAESYTSGGSGRGFGGLRRTSTSIINYYNGVFGEIIMYNHAMADSDRESVEGYLCDKWGLTSCFALAAPPVSSNLQLWLDAQDEGTVTIGTGNRAGGKVTGWSDKSGNNRNAWNNSSMNYNSTYKVGINSHNAIHFAGSGPAYLQVDLSFLKNTSYSIATLMRRTNSNASHPVLGSKTFATLYFGYFGNTGMAIEHQSNNFTSPAPAYSAGNPAIATVIFDTSAGQTIDVIEGGARYSGSDPNTTAITGMGTGTIGRSKGNLSSWNGTRYFTGYIGEIIIYNKALNGTEKTDTENYLCDKWDLSCP